MFVARACCCGAGNHEEARVLEGLDAEHLLGRLGQARASVSVMQRVVRRHGSGARTQGVQAARGDRACALAAAEGATRGGSPI